MDLVETTMSAGAQKNKPFNVMIVAQQGRLMYEAVLFAASLRHSDPQFSGRLFVAEPQPGPLWETNPAVTNQMVRDLLINDLGVTFLPFQSQVFGDDYPPGNKIEALLALPKDEPFIFMDSDTLITGALSGVPFDFDKPSASLRVTGTWPQPDLYGPGYAGIWQSLYDRFGLDFDSSLDLSQPDEYWRRYLYFNAGWFFHRCPHEFGQRFLQYASEIRDDPGDALAAQTLYPWLDQIALPLVIHSFGGGRHTIPPNTLDGDISCHYRTFPLLYARESDATVAALQDICAPNKIKKVLKQFDPIKRNVYQGRGEKVRALFDQDHLPRREQMIRNQIKKAGLWMR